MIGNLNVCRPKHRILGSKPFPPVISERGQHIEATVDLRLLRYFIACVEHKTMHEAADAVSVSQRALSKARRSLEAELGVILLDREPRGVVPTPFGDALFRYAKMIDAEMRRAVFEIDAMRGVTRGTVVVGAIPTMSGTMSTVGRLILIRYPGLRVCVC